MFFKCVERVERTHLMKMKNLPLSERPYEKFFQMGAASMSDAELLAIIIKSGTKDCSALSVAQQILTGKNGNLLKTKF